jgi:hypothetical protein
VVAEEEGETVLGADVEAEETSTAVGGEEEEEEEEEENPGFRREWQVGASLVAS